MKEIKKIQEDAGQLIIDFDRQFTFVDLFAGIGGIRLGFSQNGGECVFTSEWDTFAQETYKKNLGEDNLFGDIVPIVKKDIKDHDILVGGFPCQAYSIAGLKLGLKDHRGKLFIQVCDILREKQPKAFMLENVKNLINHDKKKTYAYIKQELENAKDPDISKQYHVVEAVLNSSTHGNMPQNRSRVFIVGFRKDLFPDISDFKFPAAIPLTNTIDKVIDFTGKKDAKFYYDPTKSVVAKKVAGYTLLPNRVYQWRRKYLRENKAGLCPTLTANMGMGGHNVPLIKDAGGIRKLTPEETLALQGFPDTYAFPAINDSYKYKQAGNSVTVPVVRRVAKAMLDFMKAKGQL